MVKISKYNILIIDDEKLVLDLLKYHLSDIGNVQIDKASDFSTAKTLISNNLYHLIICDYYLKPKTALDILDLVKTFNPNTPVIVITGGDVAEKKIALQNGATIFVSKPFDYLELTYIVKNLLKLYEINENLESAENVIIALTKAIDAKDSYTEGHSQRVAEYAGKIWKRMEIENEIEERALYIGCILHDIGKIAIPDTILKSTQHPLSEENQKLIKIHPIKGFEICQGIDYLKNALSIIRSHHEKLNGTGYPDGLKGDEIPLIVQITTIADIYDALTSKRSYRNSNKPLEALTIMKKDAKKGEISEYLLFVLQQIVLEELNLKPLDKNPLQ
jgi:putative two-component system response regulator